MNTKPTNILRGKEKKKRKKNMQSQIEVDKEDLYTLKINCKGKKTVGKERNKCKKINMFKN